ncbi:formylglycine-generating enzyme family protein, partial [bacterium]|nr:formylglycine-generating enzyme family protein [bacterium]
AGLFTMGSPTNELGRSEDELQHEVTLTKPFYAGVFEVTQKQYELVTGDNPSDTEGETHPVESVSYDMIRGEEKGALWPASSEVDEESFFGILRAKSNLGFDLPTEAQWEFACRAGTTTSLNDGNNITNVVEDGFLNKLGRYSYNIDEDEDPHAEVGSYLPNFWGLYDMHGNVSEWCLDWWDEDEEWSSDPMTDPKGAETGESRVIRGGSWDDYATDCRSAYRYYDPSNADDDCYGFRVFLVQ